MSREVCRSCGESVLWVTMPSGKKMPVEAREGGNVVVSRHGVTFVGLVVPDGNGSHVSHFAVCPQAGAWRRGKR